MNTAQLCFSMLVANKFVRYLTLSLLARSHKSNERRFRKAGSFVVKTASFSLRAIVFSRLHLTFGKNSVSCSLAARRVEGN